LEKGETEDRFPLEQLGGVGRETGGRGNWRAEEGGGRDNLSIKKKITGGAILGGGGP